MSAAFRAHLDNVPHYVYRAYDDQGVLLYIGCTYQLDVRLKAHQSMSRRWAQHMVDVQVETHPNRAEGLSAERLAISTERPLYNSDGRDFYERRDEVRAYEAAQAEKASRCFPWERAVFTRKAVSA